MDFTGDVFCFGRVSGRYEPGLELGLSRFGLAPTLRDGFNLFSSDAEAVPVLIFPLERSARRREIIVAGASVRRFNGVLVETES